MKKTISALLLVTMLIPFVGCGPLYVNARNTIAAANGLITAAQSQYLATCKANPAQGVCILINKGIDALAITITAEETYCGFKLSPVAPDPNAVCQPVKDATTALNTSLANLSSIISQIKPLVSKKSTSELIKEYDKPVTVTFADIESFKLEAM